MKNHHVNLIILGTLFAASSAMAGVDVKINADLPAPGPGPGSVQNEIRIAVDPSNSNNLVTAYNDGSGTAPNPLGVSFSTDGGVSWTDRQLTVPANPFSPGSFLDDIFDPFVGHDSLGNAYAGYIARPSTGTPGTNPPSGLFIERSTDGGSTWSGPTTIAADPGGAPVPPSGPPMTASLFNDRPDMDTGSAGEVVVTWIKDVNVGTPTSDIYYTESATPAPGPPPPGNPTNLTFSTPVIVNDNSEWLSPTTGTDRGIAPDVAIHPNGNTYVAWVDYDVTVADAPTGSIFIDSTTFGLGGLGFGADVTVASINPLPKHVSTTLATGDDARAQSYPSIGVDPTDASGNTVFLTYAEEGSTPGDEGDIFFTLSTLGGVAGSWSTPIVINDDATSTDQMHPNISVKPDGTIDIVWYDKRNSVTDLNIFIDDDMWDVYIARSIDGGLTFSTNLRVTDTSFATPTRSDGAEPWLGEYLGIDTDASDAFIAFTSSTTDSFGDVFFDRIPSARTPP